jgi:hypothetical protein
LIGISLDPRQLQIPPPKNWQDFEDLIHEVFVAEWGDPNAQKHGRRGQPQYGVDVFGSPNRDAAVIEGVQCKGKDRSFGARATVNEFDAELAKAEEFRPQLSRWTFATTAPTDARLQGHALQTSAQRAKEGRFPVSVLGWQDIERLLCTHLKVLEHFYPNLTFDVASLLADLKAIALSGRGNSSPVPEMHVGSQRWSRIDFKVGRDIGQALLGRKLGPGDAVACPRLGEADAVIAELRRGYSVRLVGDPGGGKSVCGYQAAQTLAAEGWIVVRHGFETSGCACSGGQG